MVTCIKCRQEYSEQDHRCLEEMTLEELYEPTDEMVREVLRAMERAWRQAFNEREVLDMRHRSEQMSRFLLDTATGEDLDRYAGLDVLLKPGEGDGQCPASGLFDHDPVE